MTGLTAHLAQTLVADRLRRADQARVVRRATEEGPTFQNRRVVAAAARGDEQAWALLQDRYAKRVRSVARTYRLTPHDVDDVASTTWLRLVENIGHLRNADGVGAWLETTARRECLALLRRRKRERPTDDAYLTDKPCEPVAEQRLVAAERSNALAERLALLPLHQRRVLVAMLAEPAPAYSEIAASLQIPVGSIGPTRERSLERLRRDGVLARSLDQDGDRSPEVG
jgi:RNA polymerase sigma factor (sigma-70 family)